MGVAKVGGAAERLGSRGGKGGGGGSTENEALLFQKNIYEHSKSEKL